jgi:hypothetical protein
MLSIVRWGGATNEGDDLLVVLAVDDNDRLHVVVDQNHPVVEGRDTSGPLPGMPPMRPEVGTIDFLLPGYGDSWAIWTSSTWEGEPSDVVVCSRMDVIDWLAGAETIPV